MRHIIAFNGFGDGVEIEYISNDIFTAQWAHWKSDIAEAYVFGPDELEENIKNFGVEYGSYGHYIIFVGLSDIVDDLVML